MIGPLTRAAIRTFQRSITMRETGEPTKEVFAALKETIARRDAVVSAPPPKAEAAEAEVAKREAAKGEAAEPSKAEPPKPEPATPPVPGAIDLGQPEPPPPPPTSADIARAEADAWPADTVDQVKAIQGLLRDLKFLRDTPDGLLGPATREAIRDYERTMSLAPTGEPSKALFESLKEMRNLTASKPN